MKTGIFTYHNSDRVSSLLETYALQTVLSSLGCETEIIHFAQETPPTPESAEFQNRYFSYSKPYPNVKRLRLSSSDFDHLLTGGSQIWDFTRTKGVNALHFLQFGTRDVLRTAYGVSLGNTCPNAANSMVFSRYLMDFSSVSLAEEEPSGKLKRFRKGKLAEVINPLLLLTKKEYKPLQKETGISVPYLFCYSEQGEENPSLMETARLLSGKMGLSLLSMKRNPAAGELPLDASRFLNVIEQASFVLSDSACAMNLSVLYQKEFFILPSSEDKNAVSFLLGYLGLEDRILDSSPLAPTQFTRHSIDYKRVTEIRKALKKESMVFLRHALNKDKKTPKNFLAGNSQFRCYGCSACMDVCPVEAISMEPDRFGFLYPKIKEDLCIHCKKCETTCIFQKNALRNPETPEFPKVYAASHRDGSILSASTSGGMFTPLYQKILSKNGAVAGVWFSNDLTVSYGLAHTETDCERFRGSKYVAPVPGDIKPKVKECLKTGKTVLFSGSPCQVAALKAYLGNDLSLFSGQLYTVEIICHGVGSPRIFEKYRAWLEETHNSRLTSYRFKQKCSIRQEKPALPAENPRPEYLRVAAFESGEILSDSTLAEAYQAAYAKNLIQRPACYNCEFAGLKTGVADLTIGDYWGISQKHPELDPRLGISLLKINNQHGKQLFEEIKEELNLTETPYDEAYLYNHIWPITLTVKRNLLMNRIDSDDMTRIFPSLAPEK